MRGIFDWCLEEMHYTRFNPAYAGNIIIIIIGIIHCQVQPRVCGEYAPNSSTVVLPRGSTPRMRGISDYDINKMMDIRFNPAYAGNIIIITLISHPFQVQPRVCGEYLRWTSYLTWRKGSTPRMRGIFDKSLLSLSCVGFNPAYAGNIQLAKRDVE